MMLDKKISAYVTWRAQAAALQFRAPATSVNASLDLPSQRGELVLRAGDHRRQVARQIRVEHVPPPRQARAESADRQLARSSACFGPW